MRTKLFASALAVLLVLAASAFTVASADGPANIYSATATIWFDGNGTPVVIPDANIQIVVTNNARGNVNVRAHGTLPDGAVLPASAQHYNNDNTGFVCGFGGTLEFSGVTSPSGQFSFTCKAP